jgi:hypothetical protein
MSPVRQCEILISQRTLWGEDIVRVSISLSLVLTAQHQLVCVATKEDRASAVSVV